MKSEFVIALTQLAAEKHLPREVVLAAVESALVSAYRKDAFAPGQDISAKINPTTGEVKVYVKKTVVETPTDLLNEISLTEAKEIDRTAQIGEVVNIESTPPNAGRIAAQTARQVILQRLHEAEHHAIYEEFTGKEGDIVTGMVQRITPEQIHIDLGKAEAILPSGEQVHNERYRIGQRLKLYLLEVIRTTRGPQIIVSRAHRNLLRRLFELEIPEIFDGIVDLKAVAREAGYRTKVAVAARQEGIDPVGCCVGLRGIRIQSIVNELNGEKIDVVEWADDPGVFIANALSPAQVSSTDLDETGSTAVVAVPDRQLSLAIGKEGQNARLAAKLTGWRIDIKSVSAIEAAKASLIEEAAVAEEEPATELEDLIPELVTAEAVLTPELASEPEVAGEAEMAEVGAASTGFEFVLASQTPSPTTSAEAPQIRFAEDIMSPRSEKAKAKKSSKRDAESQKGKMKSTKARPRHLSYPEEDEFEEDSYTADSSAEKDELEDQPEAVSDSAEEEDVPSARPVEAKATETSTKDAEPPEGESRPAKARQKRLRHSEEEQLEDQPEAVSHSAEKEDLPPARPVEARATETSTKDAKSPEGKSKPTKARQKRLRHSEKDELEDQPEAVSHSAEKEDLPPARPVEARATETSTKDAKSPEGKSKPAKARQKRLSHSEGEQLEE